MKREYRKPIVVFEDFTLSAHIAADCEVTNSNPSSGSCAYTVEIYPGRLVNIFTSSVTGVNACTTIEDSGMYNTVCYHIPSEDYNLFGS